MLPNRRERMMPVFDYYSREDAVITGAVVTLRKDGAETADTLFMTRPGRYSNPSVSIEPVALPDSMIYSTIADSFPIHISCENEEQIFQVDAYCLENWEDAVYVYPFGPEDNPGDYEEYGGINEGIGVFGSACRALWRLKVVE